MCVCAGPVQWSAGALGGVQKGDSEWAGGRGRRRGQAEDGCPAGIRSALPGVQREPVVVPEGQHQDLPQHQPRQLHLGRQLCGEQYDAWWEMEREGWMDVCMYACIYRWRIEWMDRQCEFFYHVL